MKRKKSIILLSALLSCSLLISCGNISETSDKSSSESGTATEAAQSGKEPESIEHIDNSSQVFETCCNEMDSLIKNYPFECEVLVYSLDKGNIYSHNIEKMMYSASTVKLTYVYYCCTQIEKGWHTLDDTFEYTEQFYSDGSGAIQYMDYGTKLTLQQLLSYTMFYSDNIGYNMLISIFGTDGYNQLMQEMGYSMRISYDNYYTELNAQILKDFMLMVYEKRNDGLSWQVVWNALISSTDSIMKKEIGYLGDMAVKCGTIEGIYHEVCFLDTDHPYIIAVMTETNLVDKGDENLFRSIAKCANSMIESLQ